jgi:hypothetical protein
MAPPVDTRLGPGTLKLGAPLVDYGAQIANVMLEPSTESEDGTPTLGNPDPLPELTESWVLTGEAIQDFEAAAGFVNWCMDHALEVVAFDWIPNDDITHKWTGEVLVTSVPIGGDVSAQNRSAFEFPVQGTPVRAAHVPTAPAPDGATSRQVAAARARRRSTVAPRASVEIGGKAAKGAK